jgi:hypothetical protein
MKTGMNCCKNYKRNNPESNRKLLSGGLKLCIETRFNMVAKVCKEGD